MLIKLELEIIIAWFCVWLFPLKDFSWGNSSLKNPNVLSYGEKPIQKKLNWIRTCSSSSVIASVLKESKKTEPIEKIVFSDSPIF